MIFKALTFSGNLVSKNIQKKKEIVWELQHVEIWKRKTDQQKELKGCGQWVTRKTVSRQDNSLPVTGHGRGANMNPFLPQWATPLGDCLLAWLRFSQDRAVIWGSSYLVLFPLLLSQVSDESCGLKVFPSSFCLHSLSPFIDVCLNTSLVCLFSSSTCFPDEDNSEACIQRTSVSPGNCAPAPSLCLWTNGMPSIGCRPFPVSLPSYWPISLPPCNTLLAFETSFLRKSILS